MTGKPKWASSILGPTEMLGNLERRSTLQNDSEIENGIDPPAFLTATNYYGKFFPRGCRGIIEALGIFCRRTGAGTMTLSYSSYPGLGPFGSVTITPGASWAWKTTAVEEMWNYDSLFIWISACSADVSWGYDVVEPYDAHLSGDSGATWEDSNGRQFIRAILTGETAGDVPVSGTINVIEIPGIAAEIASATGVAVLDGVSTSVCSAEGAGTLLEVRLVYQNSTAPTAGLPTSAVHYALEVYIDGVLALGKSNRDVSQSATATSGKCAMGQFWQVTVADPAYQRTQLHLWFPLKFKRSVEIRAMQTTGVSVLTAGYITANTVK